MPEEKWGRPRVTGWEWEMPSIDEYRARLKAYLQDLINRGSLTSSAAKLIGQQADAQIERGGVSAKLPYYKEVAKPSAEWLQQRGAEISQYLTEQAQQKWIAEHPEATAEGRRLRLEAMGWEQRARQARLSEAEQRQEEMRLSRETETERALLAKLESQAMVKEFPEWFAMYRGQPSPLERAPTVAQGQARQAAYGAVSGIGTAMGEAKRLAYQARGTPGSAAAQFVLQRGKESQAGATRAWRGGGRPAPRAEDIFGAWFKPRQEKLIEEWKAEKYREYPRLYPWFEEAGGWETGKSFQEWIESEPAAMGYLGQKREAEARRRPPQMSKRWQPAR